MDEEKYLNIPVEMCGRCGEAHMQEFVRFTNPVYIDLSDEEVLVITHWGICIKTLEPVLLYKQDVEDDD